MKGVRSLELGRSGLLFCAERIADRRQSRHRREDDDRRCGSAWRCRTIGGCGIVFRALDRGWSRRADSRAHEDRSLVPAAVRRDRRAARATAAKRRPRAARRRRHAPTLKRAGFGDAEIALALGHQRGGGPRRDAAVHRHQAGLQARRHLRGRVRVVHAVHVQLVRADLRVESERRDKVVILGSGPNRIGQGIEFDYCCCHAAFALREEGFETVMINCNPETVSTDYDTADRLYFQPLTFEDVMAVIETERSARRRRRRASCSSAARRR